MYVGKPLPRPEDFRFLTGRGKYVDDIKLPRCASAGFLRSPHAHARILRLDASRALKRPGVIRIVTAQDWAKAGHGKLVCVHPRPSSDGQPRREVHRRGFAAQEAQHAPDVGGGFGNKVNFHVEVSTIVWMSRELGRPVKWTATRSETLQSDTQARDHATEARMAFAADGEILALQVDTIACLGGYLSNFAPSIPGNSYPQTITGLYTTPALDLRVRTVYTNTVPIDAYRGSGRPEATWVNERLLENAAREMGIDVVEIRRRNLLPSSDFPYKTPVGRVYDLRQPSGLVESPGRHGEVQGATPGAGRAAQGGQADGHRHRCFPGQVRNRAKPAAFDARRPAWRV